MSAFLHLPVLSQEAPEALVRSPDGLYVDGTFGRGGHSRLILKRLSPKGRLIAFDRDPQAVAAAAEIRDPRFQIIHAPFSSMKPSLAAIGIDAVDGVFLDIGVSSPQIDDPERGYGQMNIIADDDALRHIARIAGGDTRAALGAVELAVLTTPADAQGIIHITLAVAEESIQKPMIRCDESLYYDMLSAFCKSLRGSDSDAALAWFARLIYAGVDPKLIARRIIAHASEDVGLANPIAMLQAEAAARAVEFVGMPEARLPLAQAIIAICESPKSNSVCAAVDAAMADAEKGGYGAVPVHLRDTHYAGHDRIGSGDGYKYPHDYPGHYVRQNYMPVELQGKKYYFPSDMGHEATIRKNQEIREGRK